MGCKRLLTTLILLTAFPMIAGAVEPDVKANIEKTLKEVLPEVNITSIKPSQVKGLYQVMEGAEVYYVTGDGRYFFHGELYDLKERHNLTEISRTEVRDKLLKKLSKNEYIEFSPAHPKHVVYVFTDVDCPYCRRWPLEGTFAKATSPIPGAGRTRSTSPPGGTVSSAWMPRERSAPT